MQNNLLEIREAYDNNYKQICHIIDAMGGQEYLKMHRVNRTNLYLKLLKLQQQEHMLDNAENNYNTNMSLYNSEFYSYA